MATTTVQTTDLAQLIADRLSTIDGLRVHWYVSDAVRPPSVVIGQPSVDYSDTAAGFCSAVWSFPLTLVVSRNSDREAQLALSRFLQAIVTTLADTEADGVSDVAPIAARPITVTVSGAELPGYAIDVNVYA